MSVSNGSVPGGVDADVAKLHELGYAQELHRRMGGFSNFAVSFTIISVLSGCLTLYYFGMEEGGPVDIVWGWIIVGFFTTIVGLGMAEIASAYPTAGGLYYWSAKLAKKNAGAWSWFTGWFNLLGQVAVTAGIDYGFAFFFSAFLNMMFGFQNTSGWILVVYAGNPHNPRAAQHLRRESRRISFRCFSLVAHLRRGDHRCGPDRRPSHHASASFVFTKFINLSGFSSKWCVSAHMSEETMAPDLASSARSSSR